MIDKSKPVVYADGELNEDEAVCSVTHYTYLKVLPKCPHCEKSNCTSTERSA